MKRNVEWGNHDKGMVPPRSIAIDGPGGAGKSTAAKEVARRLGIAYLDTGAMYRAVGLKCLRAGVSPTDAVSVERLLEHTAVEIRYDGGAQKVLLDGEDVTALIRAYEVSKAASDVSAIPAVRLKMVEIQREIAARNSVVLDGRDIGT
ncbi:MAG: (d)CMP kinase, partial [Firmicutes bacterium]|nr:(d)CMP kinase [Bacillota bacterium]